ncbi:unknown [Bacillus sp. CAG:988]|nr:unknown [Bacillus sp. CAG:988]
MIYCYHQLLLGGVTLKYQKVMKRCAIVLSIAFLVLEVYLWIRMQNTWDDLILSQSSYESAGLMFAGLFQYGSFFLGIFLIPIVWLEYWLITIFCHVYQKYLGFKKIFLATLIAILILVLLVLFIRILCLIWFAL